MPSKKFRRILRNYWITLPKEIPDNCPELIRRVKLADLSVYKENKGDPNFFGMSGLEDTIKKKSIHTHTYIYLLIYTIIVLHPLLPRDLLTFYPLLKLHHPCRPHNSYSQVLYTIKCCFIYHTAPIRYGY